MFHRTLLLAAVAATGIVLAQDEAAFHKEMKSIDQHAAVMRKLSAKTGDEVVPVNARLIAGE